MTKTLTPEQKSRARYAERSSKIIREYREAWIAVNGVSEKLYPKVKDVGLGWLEVTTDLGKVKVRLTKLPEYTRKLAEIHQKNLSADSCSVPAPAA